MSDLFIRALHKKFLRILTDEHYIAHMLSVTDRFLPDCIVSMFSDLEGRLKAKIAMEATSPNVFDHSFLRLVLS